MTTSTIEPRGTVLARRGRAVRLRPPRREALRRRDAAGLLRRRRTATRSGSSSASRPRTVRCTPRCRAAPTPARCAARWPGSSPSTTTATAFLEVGRRDPAIGRCSAAAPGLRPVLFHSPYEAAAWAVLSARRGRAQAIALRERLGRGPRPRVHLAGVEQAAFPTPAAAARRSTESPALPEQRVAWLHGVARAALDGRLDAGHAGRHRSRRGHGRAAPADRHRPVLRRADAGPRRPGRPTSCRPTSARSLAAAGELYGLASRSARPSSRRGPSRGARGVPGPPSSSAPSTPRLA